eukprot:Sspe_Gene.4730::Locus_1557_Transcript_4_5_Confidence_0.222_Length_1590::g.4730::m.4730
MVISNCVVNLSPDKPSVLREVYRVLADGGEFYFSDVYCDRRLPEKVQKHEVLWGECIAGAMYIEDFIREANKVGFTDPRMLAKSEIFVTDPELSEIVGKARFFSITYRLFKLPGMLETKCEDYGQYAVYKGTIPGHPNGYMLDDHHDFETKKPMLVCGNTGAMVGEGRTVVALESTLKFMATVPPTMASSTVPPPLVRPRANPAAVVGAAAEPPTPPSFSLTLPSPSLHRCF